MPAQEQEVRKNYIGIVDDRTEEQRAIEPSAHSSPLMRDYLRGLMAALLSRRNKPAQAFRTTPRRLTEMQNGISELP